MSFTTCRDLCILCSSVTNEDSSRGQTGIRGTVLKNKIYIYIYIYILRVYVIWYVSEIWIWLVHVPPQTLFHHAAREGDCSGVAAMLKRKHNNIHRCSRQRWATLRPPLSEWTHEKKTNTLEPDFPGLKKCEYSPFSSIWWKCSISHSYWITLRKYN